MPCDVRAEARALQNWLAEGETADDSTRAGMNFYVEGTEGDIPQ